MGVYEVEVACKHVLSKLLFFAVINPYWVRNELMMDAWESGEKTNSH